MIYLYGMGLDIAKLKSGLGQALTFTFDPDLYCHSRVHSFRLGLIALLHLVIWKCKVLSLLSFWDILVNQMIPVI